MKKSTKNKIKRQIRNDTRAIKKELSPIVRKILLITLLVIIAFFILGIAFFYTLKYSINFLYSHPTFFWIAIAIISITLIIIIAYNIYKKIAQKKSKSKKTEEKDKS